MRPTRTLSAAVAAIAITLLAPVAASASPAPGASASATGTARTSSGTTTDAQHLDINWSLGAGEYACGVTATSSDAQVSTPVDPGATSTTLDLPATGGTPIKVELQWVAPAVQPAQPSDACFGSRSVSSTTVTAATYTAPAPAPPPASPTPAPTAPQPSPTPAASVGQASTTTSTPTVDPTADLQAQIDALRDRIAALESRTKALEDYLAAGGFVTDTVSSAYTASTAT